jgi:hypothetical protein
MLVLRTLVIAGVVAALPLAPLAAQRTDVTADEAIENAKQMYGPPPPSTNCSKAKEDMNSNEIVVCAKNKQDDAQFRVKGTSELDPDSDAALNDGMPRAPDVAGEGIFKGKGISLGGTPDPAYIIDFELLPETPQGSDADKIAKGEKKAD